MDHIIINNNIIKKLLSSYNDHDIDGNTYYYLGKGGEGVIYRLDDIVIKIYTKIEMNNIVKEFYTFGLLKELKQINKNVINIDRYYLSLSNPVLLMELMDGDLAKWCTIMLENKQDSIKNLTDESFDELWLGMIFQVTFGLMFLNHLNILHTDTKSKNILYKKTNALYDDYVIAGKTYTVPFKYIFKIADFGAIQILGLGSNKIFDEEILERIKKREDLYELSRILYRIIVNYGINDYNWFHINELLKKDNLYREYRDKQRDKLNKDLSHMPQKIRDKMLLRSLIYYAIENNIIKSEEIITKHSLRMPSSKVSNILDKLTDVNIKNVFDLFDVFVIGGVYH